jgi:aspartate racemase
MRTIGIIGGVSEQSTAIYYARLNEQSRLRCGRLTQVPCIIWSLNFEEIHQLQQKNDWASIGALLADTGKLLVKAGAECLIIAANTLHKVADLVASTVDVPLLHVADITASAIKAAKLSKPILLATRYTMEQNFYVDRLRSRELDILIPEESERIEIHRIIFDELCKGIVTPESKKSYLQIIERMKKQGADCAILGCTEIGMLLKQQDVSLPLFDTAILHADAALEWSLEGEQAARWVG